MNLYQKLQNVRVELYKMDLQKSGLNKFSNFKYFELKDFLPQAQELMLKYGLFAYEEISTDIATITVIDTESDDLKQFSISMPSTTVDLKGATAIQNLGSVQTYMKRYLWVNLVSIVESDTLDAVIGKDEKAPKAAKNLDTPIAKMKALCTAKAATNAEDVKKALKEVANVTNPNATSITEDQANEIIARLEKI